MSVRSSSILMNALDKAEKNKKAAAEAQEDDTSQDTTAPAGKTEDVLEFELLDEAEESANKEEGPASEAPAAPVDESTEPPLEFESEEEWTLADEAEEPATVADPPIESPTPPEPEAALDEPATIEFEPSEDIPTLAEVSKEAPEGEVLTALADKSTEPARHTVLSDSESGSDIQIPEEIVLKPHAGQILNQAPVRHGPSSAFLFSMMIVIACGLGYWGFVYFQSSNTKSPLVTVDGTDEASPKPGSLQARMAALQQQTPPAGEVTATLNPQPSSTEPATLTPTTPLATTLQQPEPTATAQSSQPDGTLTLATPIVYNKPDTPIPNQVEVLPTTASARPVEAPQARQESSIASLDNAFGMPPKNTTPTQQNTTQPAIKAKRREEALHPTAKTADMQIQPTRQSVDKPLNTAYNAWLDGDDARAQRSYESVLSLDPHNRDALLGLAAVSLRQGESQRAYQFYQRVKRQYPSDPVAQAGIVNLLGQYADSEDILDLSDSLARNPHDAYLHFSLGNVYARQGRWGEAQQAYFEAYRRDAAQPDHVYNLAVSLEHLGQPKAALPFYQQAAELADQRSVSFDLAVLKQRIAVLQKISTP
ncbi:MAG: tetratricopeptide repeat protein [Pseudomonadota bacterium]